MESLGDYLTKEGWKQDLEKTKDDFSDLGKSSNLTDLVTNENGSMDNGFIVFGAAIVAMPVCAYGGSYVGEGFGWLLGNIVDFIPYARDVAPWLAERSGLINDTKEVVGLNENLYQTKGAIAGFWGGLLAPWMILWEYLKNF